MKRVLFFGMYDKKYSRTRVLQNGFRRNGWEIAECHVDPSIDRGLYKYWKLALLGITAKKENYDLVFVGFPGHVVVWIARLLFGRRIVFDAFLSNYDANLDRGLYTADSWRAKKDWLIDKWSCMLASKVFLDTQALRDYFVSEFSLPPEKCLALALGADDTVFMPLDVPEPEKFTVHFHGTFIPLQGVSYIVEAANILRDEGIHFRLVGGGQEAGNIDAMIERLSLRDVVEHVPKVPVASIPEYIARSHVVLGIFGDVERARRAVPNKVYEAMAVGKAIITMDCRGIRQVPHADKVFVLVPAADGMALAEAIRTLRRDETKRLEHAWLARDTYVREYLPEKIVSDLLAALK